MRTEFGRKDELPLEWSVLVVCSFVLIESLLAIEGLLALTEIAGMKHFLKLKL